MKTLLEYAPWIIFGLVYKFGGGLYPATAALMGAMTLLLALFWVQQRSVPQMHLALTLMVLVFGAATLILRDVRFLQWKASVIYWLLGLIVAGSVWVGKKTLLERMMGSGLPEGATVPAASWRSMSLLTGAFYIALGGLNLWVALTRSEADWVTFKVWIAFPLALVFIIGVVFYLLRGVLTKEAP
jgi:intracellular septation protein